MHSETLQNFEGPEMILNGTMKTHDPVKQDLAIFKINVKISLACHKTELIDKEEFECGMDNTCTSRTLCPKYFDRNKKKGDRVEVWNMETKSRSSGSTYSKITLQS